MSLSVAFVVNQILYHCPHCGWSASARQLAEDGGPQLVPEKNPPLCAGCSSAALCTAIPAFTVLRKEDMLRDSSEQEAERLQLWATAKKKFPEHTIECTRAWALWSAKTDFDALRKASAWEVQHVHNRLRTYTVPNKQKLSVQWFSRLKEIGLSPEAACHWAGEHHGWFVDPAKGRPSFSLTPAMLIQTAWAELARMTPADGHQLQQAYLEHLQGGDSQ